MYTPPGHRSFLLLSLLVGLGGCLDYPSAGDDTGDGGPVDAELGSLRGTVTDGAGAPVPDAFLTTTPRGFEARSGADGGFRVEHLPPGSYQLVAAAVGLDASTSAPVEVQAGVEASVDLVLAALPAGGRLSVRLRGPDDAPLEGATVTTSAGVSGLTDASGDLVLDGVAGASVDVVLGDDGSTWAVQVPDLAISAAGGEQIALQLSGRPPAGADYVGAAVCASCHGEVAAAHDGTLHADALGLEIAGDLRTRFSLGETVTLGDATAQLALDGGTPVVTLVDAAGDLQVLEVAGLIASDRSRTVPWVDDGDQAWPLPLAFLAADPGRDPAYPDAQARFVPYDLDRWFDAGGRFVDLDPARSAEASCFGCHSSGSDFSLRGDGGVDMVGAGGSGRWLDPGVSCESCHGPGSVHADSAADRAFTITSPELLPAARSQEVCGQCHSRTVATASGLPFPQADGFHPGMDLGELTDPAAVSWPSGAAAASNQQLDELRASTHGVLGMTCLDCHGPHGLGEDGTAWPHMGRLNPDDNSLCLSCHLDRSFESDPEQVEDHVLHARFDPTSDHQTGRCATCHMPATAATVAFSERSGAGDASSHLFTVRHPQETVDWFDAAGASTLAVGEFPNHSCAECHDYAEWYWQTLWSADFPGPAGDPRQRQTHVLYQDAFVEKYE